MTKSEKLKHDLKSLAVAFIYFAVWVGALFVIKKLVIEEYEILFTGLTLALLGALVLSKVVLLMEPISLGKWMQRQPALVSVVLRTILYGAGVFIVLMIKTTLEGLPIHGGFFPSLKAVCNNPDLYHIAANTICLSGALLGFNILSVMRERLGERGLVRLFTTPLSGEADSGEKKE